MSDYLVLSAVLSGIIGGLMYMWGHHEGRKNPKRRGSPRE